MRRIFILCNLLEDRVMKISHYGLVIFFSVFGCVASSFAASLTAVSINEKADSALIKCQVRGAFDYKVFTLSNPNRVVVDLFDARNMKRGMQKETRLGESSLLSSLRVGKAAPNTLRLVFDADRPMRVVQVTPKRGREKMGLMLELKPKESPKTKA
jgi:hypothetical protein